MNNLEELKRKYKELGKEIKRLEKEKLNKRWRAKYKEYYYCISFNGGIDCYRETEDSIDNFLYKTRNYFKTEEEAQEYLENINTYYDLMDLAEELNNSEKIDWNNGNQPKYYISYNFHNNEIETNSNFCYKSIGQIYCLDIYFIEVAIEKIGKERLEKLFKGGTNYGI